MTTQQSRDDEKNHDAVLPSASAADGTGAHDATPEEADPRVAFVDQVERQAEQMRSLGREITGTGGTVDRRSLRQVFREQGLSFYPLIAVFVLALSELLHNSAFAVETPDIARTFGLSPVFFNIMEVIGQIVSLIAPILAARYVQNRARRAQVMIVAAIIFCIITPMTGFVAVAWLLLITTTIDRATTSASDTVSSSLLIDLYPPQVRVRVVAVLTAATIAADAVAQGIVALLTGPADLTWRGVFIVLGVLSLLCVFVAIGLRDPGYGKYDTERLRAAVRETDTAKRPGDAAPDTDTDAATAAAEVPDAGEQSAPSRTREVRLSFVEAMQRIWAIKTMRLGLISAAMLSLTAPVSIYIAFYQANELNLNSFDRSLIALGTTLAAALAYIVLAPISDRLFQRSPATMFYLAGALSIVGLPIYAFQVFATSVPMLVTMSLIGVALGSMFGPAMIVGTMSLVPAPLRPHVGAISAIFGIGGTIIGTALLGSVAPTHGLRVAMVIVVLISLAGSIVGLLMGRTVEPDLDQGVENVIVDQAIENLRSDGVQVPLLAARGIEFTYGQTQVLFGMDFSINEGESVALLGVNGAGKSTLLRVLSGLETPQRGSVHLDGHDITFVSAAHRSALGVAQVPGGRAVFRELTVLENLRCFGYSAPGGRRELSRRIDEALSMFPRLAERSGTRVEALSGGEQQMLALSKAFVMDTRVLLIDELSLGLAPVVVEQMLEMVRRIQTAGAAVVLVEQSVNVALSVTERAYFLEHGRVMFDGPSSDLLARGDLLRSVFLSGAAAMKS